MQRFISHVSAKQQAFVVVQHMAPTHPGLLAELLQRATPLPVVEVESGVREAQPRLRDPTEQEHGLHAGHASALGPNGASRGLRLPIDYFFVSLADELGERCVGVLLSGMGADGTKGMAAMAKRGGALFVESPASAKFDAMPRSALEAGLGAIAAPVEELPRADRLAQRGARHVDRSLAGRRNSRTTRRHRTFARSSAWFAKSPVATSRTTSEAPLSVASTAGAWCTASRASRTTRASSERIRRKLSFCWRS